MNLLKKPFCLFFLTVCLLGAILFTGCTKAENSALTPLVLSEVVHSVFYAPQYAAMELGYFAEEGIELTVEIGGGADKCMTALLSGGADVILCGTEAGIYVQAEGAEDVPQVIAQLTQRAGNFLVSREAASDFSWDDVRRRTIIGGRVGGMPEMILEYILNQHGIQVGTDVTVLTNIETSATAAAFTSGTGDYTTEFEPNATTLEKEGAGYVVASLGTDSGYVPYTVYFASSSAVEEEPELLQAFTDAIYRGQVWCSEHTAAEIAEVISPQFSETDLSTLTAIIERYQSQDTWTVNPMMSTDSFDLIQDILLFSGTLEERIAYDDLVNPDFARAAMSGKIASASE